MISAGRKVAVIGAGISGLSAAWHLRQTGDQPCLFEKSDRLGGHTHSHEVLGTDGPLQVDTGFIIFNEDNYPNFSAFLGDLNVASQPSEMSFAVRDDINRFEYGTRGAAALLGRGLQAFRPSYLRLWRDLFRFYGELNSGAIPDLSLGEYLAEQGYSDSFASGHILPMCSALWSQPSAASRDLSLRHVVEFMRNHHLLQLAGRPQWRVIRGGSSTYVDRLTDASDIEIVTNSGEIRIHRKPNGIVIQQFGSTRLFDAVVIACHSDEALEILASPTDQEQAVLSQLPYQDNSVFLHSDPTFMPRRKRCWSSWNVVRDLDGSMTTTYWMNRLQGLPGEHQFFVTLNPNREPQHCHWHGTYSHPHFTRASYHAQTQWSDISRDRTSFAGAYWGAGFHEDGFVSGKRCAQAIALELRDVA